MEKSIEMSVNLDADEQVFFDRELESVKSRTYDKKYPELKAKRYIPVSTEAGPGAETITYQQYDHVGIFKIISSYADDLPRSDVRGKEFSTPVRSIAGAYGYSIQSIRAAIQAGKPLETRKAEATRRAYEERVNDIAWNARPSVAKYSGLTGFIYNPNVTKYEVDDGASSSVKPWSGKSAEEILFDMNKAVDTPIKLTLGTAQANTILIPLDEYTLISSTRNSDSSDLTILEYFKRNRPGVTVDWVNDLSDILNPRTGSGNVNVMIAYRLDPEVLTLELPQPYEQFPAQERNLEFVIPAHGRIGGVIIYYPLEIAIIDGI
jgi:hypothetical protein